jgi:beta-lactamase regulating signal transducer with metallopeptidase domain
VSSLELALANLLAWSLQIGILATAAAALDRLVPVERPGARLAMGQALLALMVALPLVEPWPATAAAVSSWSLSLAPAAVPRTELSAARGPLAVAPSWCVAIALLLLLGVAVRLARLAAAWLELRAVGRRARALEPPPWLRTLRDEVAPRARFAVSDRAGTPAGCGLWRPLILLPPGFESAERERQAQLALHELLHVRRGDWLALLIEELVLVALFFHPALHWLVARIRLAREQCVDEAVVRRLGGRVAYCESLVAAARATALASAIPAVPFFREGHLRERVDLLLKEVSMPITKTLRNALLTAGVLLAMLAFTASAVPLQSSAAKAPAAIETADKAAMGGPRIVRKVNPAYPPEAKAEKVEGLFVIDVVIGRDGAVREARVVASAPSAERLKDVMAKKGTPEATLGDSRLAAAALEAVRSWQYEPVLKDGQAVEVRATVTVNFKLS